MSVRIVNGSITVSLLESRIIDVQARGHLNSDHVTAAQRAITSIAAGLAGLPDTLFDGSAIVSFEPGLPMAWVRWALAGQIKRRRVAIVGRPGPMLSVATTFKYLLPTLTIRLFADREDALEYLREE